jgi:hypothetical protein
MLTGRHPVIEQRTAINGSTTTLTSGNYQLPVTVAGTGHGGMKATAHLQVSVAEKVRVGPED